MASLRANPLVTVQIGLEGPDKKPLDKPVATITEEEPTVEFIHELGKNGEKTFDGRCGC